MLFTAMAVTAEPYQPIVAIGATLDEPYVSIDPIMGELYDNGDVTDGDEVDETGEDDSGISTNLIIALVAGGVVLLLIIIFFAVKQKK